MDENCSSVSDEVMEGIVSLPFFSTGEVVDAAVSVDLILSVYPV